jgi:serine phosphatase RsbU (regulator of sigma subunit)
LFRWAAIRDELWQTVAAYQGPAQQFDDFTLVVVEKKRAG